MKKFVYFLISFIFFNMCKNIGGIKGKPMDSKDFVGNVAGSVINKKTGLPIQNAIIYLLNEKKNTGKEIKKIENYFAQHSNNFIPMRITDKKGNFLINYVPTPDSGMTYQLIIEAQGFVGQIVDSLFVPPGASLSPTLVFSLEKGDATLFRHISNKELDTMLINKNKKRVNQSTKNNGRDRILSIAPFIYATREGLVGRTTSNGHVIQPNDHFCALPSTSVIDQDGYSTFSVNIYYGSKEIDNVPIWDVGPQNEHDDYWEPEDSRNIYNYLTHGGQKGLGQYVPEIDAAYLNNYNDGYSGQMSKAPDGQPAYNPAGIDLADGTFYDLGLNDNEYIQVVYNWQDENSVINDDIKQWEQWFGSVTVVEKDDHTFNIHITNGNTVDVDPGCNLILNANIRLIVDNGATLILEAGVHKNFASGAGIDVANGGTFVDNTVTGICNTCPPYAPENFSATISGQNVILNWNTYTDQSGWGLQIYKNGQPYGNWIQTSQTSYTDINATNSLPATYTISAFNNYGDSYSEPISVILSPTTITSNTPWNGVIYVNSNVTVNSGAQLQIEAGTKIIFNSGPAFTLTVNGILNSEGNAVYPVTFTSNSTNPSPGNWGSIVFNGANASESSLSYTNIQYGTEIDITNANNVNIQNCSITNSSMHGLNFSGGTGCSAINNIIENSNTAHGIVVQNSANVTCTGNIIKKTNLNHSGVGIYFGGGGNGIVAQNDIEGFSWGICAIWGSSPTSHNVNYPSKNNRITNCGVGLDVYYNSYPTFGIPSAGDTYGGNSIYSNSSNVNVGISYPSIGSGLYGCYNWWGSYPPNTSLFSVGSASYFNYTPSNEIDLWAGYPLPSIKQLPIDTAGGKLENQMASAPNVVVNTPGSISGVTDSLFAGIDLRSRNKTKEAKDFFISYIKNHEDNQAAYTYLFNCADSSTTPDLINFFSSLPPKASKEQKLLLSYLYLKEGNIGQAKKINDDIIQKNPNSPLGIRAKLNNFYIALYNENDVNTASSLLNEVENESSLSTPVEIATAEDDYNVYGNMLAANSGSTLPKIQQMQTVDSNPTSYSLLQNYPNPFNPTTMISYQVPNDGFVTLKIYDMLGREVRTLVNGYKSQGKYSVSFDASNISSGVYFYQLKSGNYTSIKKMVLLK